MIALALTLPVAFPPAKERWEPSLTQPERPPKWRRLIATATAGFPRHASVIHHTLPFILMCCRYALRKSPATLAQVLPELKPSARILDHFRPRHNIAPTQPVLAVRRTQGIGGGAEFTFLSWGLVPHWAKDASLATSLFNARAESAAQKPSFKGPLRHHRCLIPADGFYEWARGGHEAAPLPGSLRSDGVRPAAVREASQPWFFTRTDGEPFCFAALWEHWGSPDGSEIESCALLTVAANADMRPYHDRMPLLITPEHYSRWLDPSLQHPFDVADLLLPQPAGTWQAQAVGTYVNNARNDSAECLLPPAPPAQGDLFA